MLCVHSCSVLSQVLSPGSGTVLGTVLIDSRFQTTEKLGEEKPMALGAPAPKAIKNSTTQMCGVTHSECD